MAEAVCSIPPPPSPPEEVTAANLLRSRSRVAVMRVIDG